MNTRKKILFASTGLVVVAAVALLTLQLTHTTHFFQSSEAKQKEQAAKYNADAKQAVINGNGNPSKTGASGTPTANPGTYTAPTDSNGISLTASQDGANVVVTTKLSGYSDGSCALTVTNPTSGKSTVKTVNVIYAPEFSTCAGYSIPVSELGSGNWSLSLAVTAGGTTNTKTTGITVQ